MSKFSENGCYYRYYYVLHYIFNNFITIFSNNINNYSFNHFNCEYI